MLMLTIERARNLLRHSLDNIRATAGLRKNTEFTEDGRL